MTVTSRDPRVVIIGSGIAGITAAVALQEAGFHEFTILEKGSDVGGVWFWNRYPGLTCDFPSHLYQFSFAAKPDWSQVCAPGEEIQRYLRSVVDRFGLDRHLLLDAEVVSAEFNGKTWQVTTTDGTTHEADFVVAATGLLHHPNLPDIPGLESFAGDVVHTARWDEGLETSGRRIAVIGTGSTGVQVVSALQPQARRVRHFVRSPQWVMWAPLRLPQPAIVGAILRRMPRLNDALYRRLLRSSDLAVDIMTRPSWRRRLAQEYARMSLRVQVRDPHLRASLTPDDEPFCKRQVVSDTYYRAIAAPNADLVADAIERIEPHGIRTVDGRLHEADLLILATGFKAHNYMRPMRVVGRDGTSIDDAWAKGPRAYRMTAIPGFPNFFTMLGPNSPIGTISVQHTAELNARYITRWMERFARREFDLVEVTEQATQRFNDDVAEALAPTVWNTGCNSWYLTDGGTIDLWPFDRDTLTSMLTEPDDHNFHLTDVSTTAG